MKTVFDFVAPDGELVLPKVPSLLNYFYRLRPEGPTQSGSYLYNFPQEEALFLISLFGDDENARVPFEKLMDSLMNAQGARDAPAPAPRPAKPRAAGGRTGRDPASSRRAPPRAAPRRPRRGRPGAPGAPTPPPPSLPR